MKFALTLSIALSVTASLAHALPFNDDMVMTKNLRTGSTVRMPVEGTIAVGALEHRVANKDEATNLKNPIATSAESITRGKRSYEVNCSPCHGDYTASGRVKGVVAEKSILEAPDIGGALYKDRPDGLFFATIYFGGMAVMPAVGYKLAPEEAWNIVNYLRDLQKGK